MPVSAELREALIDLAGPRGVFDSRELWLGRAARVSGISLRMAKALFYGEVADPKSSVVEAIRAAHDKQKRQSNLEAEAISELHELRERVARLETLLRETTAHMG